MKKENQLITNGLAKLVEELQTLNINEVNEIIEKYVVIQKK